jgi:putative phosphoesterase
MKLAVLSDSHDNIWKLDQALPELAQADAVLHCGDLCSPFMIKRLAEGVGETPIHVVWGNNDGDQFTIGRVAREFKQVTLHGDLAAFELGDVPVAANHYPEIAEGLAASGEFDIVCYGHNHTQKQEKIGGCLLLNPGELMGMNGASTIAIVNLVDMGVQFVTI